ncbi:Uncharacterised protein [Legionella busanensis]|uniref:Uncharacterized protein n=2 Tax=Legionella busanensis TaxID=190655 RepID=A0A378JRD7_9GAMM|nr:hypothetical protein [Legionella busanensis]STX52460.1 Uncharacterised protein [Legionella busanensis]
MSYTKIEVLARKWNLFEEAVKLYIQPYDYHLAEIQKLMTAKSVVDLNNHAIYVHTEYLHRLTLQLINLRDNNSDDELIREICQLWTDLLENRNQTPLKIKHDKRLDGICTFNFSLQVMQGKPYGFNEVQLLERNNISDVQKAIEEIKHLDCLAHGINFADLPIIGDTVLSALLNYKDTICFLAKDRNDQIIGYSWGILLRDIPVDNKNKVNVFWVMNLAKHPDFYDPNIKIGTVLRQHIADTFKAKTDCHFLGYKHNLNHKFHLEIVEGSVANKDEKIHLGPDEYKAKSKAKYDTDTIIYSRSHLIRANNNEYPYPKFKQLNSALFNAFWQAAPCAKDFILGAMLIYGRSYYQQWTHSMLQMPIQQRIEEPVSAEQQICDMAILKKIILSAEWNQQGTTLFFDKCIPKTIQKMQQLVKKEQVDFSTLRASVANSHWALSRNKLTAYFYFAMTQSTSASAAINLLVSNKITPKKWIELISEERQMVNQQGINRLAVN